MLKAVQSKSLMGIGLFLRQVRFIPRVAQLGRLKVLVETVREAFPG